VVLLADAGLRPQEALALEWRHVRAHTLLVEGAVSDGQIKTLKIAGTRGQSRCSSR